MSRFRTRANSRQSCRLSSRRRQTVVVPLHGTVKRGTLASILRQAGMTATEFLNLL
ncbi:type II toxin-antitoxin system HicA family toxin [Nocardia sp. NPDC052278]|uniref:type II toxin-antitoxin system HicA family toxin n=1 Tax=unclassified Nocardia TaxID=2637762 RepID=UPI0036861DF9